MSKRLINVSFIGLLLIFVCMCVSFSCRTNGQYILTPPIDISNELFLSKEINSMTLRQKIASLFILHIQGTDIATIKNYLDKYQPSGIIFMQDNIPASTAELAVITSQLQTNAKFPYLFAIDEEGGVVNRLPDDHFPSAADLKYLPASQTETAFNQRALALKSAGMNLNFGVIADTTSNPDSFIFPRTFGGDPNEVASRVAAAVNGENGLVFSTLKHYPGHGEAEADSHFSTPITDIEFSTWQSRDELPFKNGIKAGADFVMFGHLIYSKVDIQPASLSKTWHEIISKNDNFKGITITDDMVMLQQSNNPAYSDPAVNAISAINAGNTMLLYVIGRGDETTSIDPGTIFNGVQSAVENGTIDEAQINKNVRKILKIRHKI